METSKGLIKEPSYLLGLQQSPGLLSSPFKGSHNDGIISTKKTGFDPMVRTDHKHPILPSCLNHGRVRV